MARNNKGKATVSYPGLLNDVLFKIVFGGSQSGTVLKFLLNALLQLSGGDKIAEVEILSPSPEKFYFDDKGPVLDLRARDEKGTHYNVEVQLRASGLDFIKRSLYYTARLYCDQLKTGHQYHLLARSVSISLLDFVLFPGSSELHSRFTLWEEAQQQRLTDDLELHYIELPKFTPDKPKSVQTKFEKWLYLLKFSDLYHDRELPENIKDEEGIQMAIDSMRKAYARDDIRYYIEAQEKADKDRASILAAAVRKERELLEVERQLLEKERQLTDEARQRADQASKRADQASKRADQASKRADQASQRADEESQRADQASKKADEESQRADREAQKAERLAARLRELGEDPDL